MESIKKVKKWGKVDLFFLEKISSEKVLLFFSLSPVASLVAAFPDGGITGRSGVAPSPVISVPAAPGVPLLPGSAPGVSAVTIIVPVVGVRARPEKNKNIENKNKYNQFGFVSGARKTVSVEN